MGPHLSELKRSLVQDYTANEWWDWDPVVFTRGSEGLWDLHGVPGEKRLRRGA